MSLNPQRAGLSHAGQEASRLASPFQRDVEIAMGEFRTVRDDLERQVRHGEATPKAARHRAVEAADRLAATLLPRTEGYSPVPRNFLDRLVEATEARKVGRERGSLESLQRDTNRLLRLQLVEQQLASRAGEFEGRAFVKPMVGNGQPAPTLESLLAFHEQAAQGGDDAAMEWGRRQLEALRPRVATPEEHQKIDIATDRPDRLNPRIVARYVEAMQTQEVEAKEAFVSEATATRDANACAAAFLLAREAPEGAAARWVRNVLNGVKEFPDAALNALRSWEADARKQDADAARAHAEFAIAEAHNDARFPGLQAPSAVDLERMERMQARPVARADESIGLALDRRGALPEEIELFSE